MLSVIPLRRGTLANVESHVPGVAVDVAPAPSGTGGAPRRREVAKGRLAVVIPGLVALALCAHQAQLRNVRFGAHDYGEGVYLGAAIRLIHGTVPYKDFIFVHPPGIALLMAPVAALGGHFGSYTSLAVARDLTMLVSAINASLAALVVRHRGRTASLIAGLALACFPLAPAADSSLLLEPYLDLFCLLGLVLMFQRGRVVLTPGRLLLAGLAFGFAGAIKVWAILIIVPAAAVALVSLRRLPARLVAGIAAGFVLPCLPFFVLAPGSFVHDVIVLQAGRIGGGAKASSLSDRIDTVTGVTAFGHHAFAGVALGLLLVALVATTFLTAKRTMDPVGWTVLLAATASVAAVLTASSLFIHYTYFPAPYLAMLVGLCVGCLVQRTRPAVRPGRLLFRRASLGLTCAAMVAVLAPAQMAYAQTYLARATDTMPLNFFIPSGSCAITDHPSLLISADLYVSGRPDCPVLVDPFGTWLAYGPSQPPPYDGPYPAAFVAKWQQWLQRADYLVTYGGFSVLIPWTPELRAWFARTFFLVNNQGGLYVYCHVQPAAGGRPNRFAPCLSPSLHSTGEGLVTG